MGEFSPDPAAVFRQLDSGGVILNVESGDYYQLNPTGRIIWEAIGDGAERESLIEKVTEIFDIDSDQAAVDVDQFLVELKARSLIRESD